MSRLNMELRYNPLIGDWVIVSGERVKRPWQPEGFCPFCPGSFEVGYGWSALSLDNRYPSLSRKSSKPRGRGFFRVKRAYGVCRVTVETPMHNIDDLNELSLEHMVKVVELIVDEVKELSSDPYVKYVFLFRNKGKEVGVSLTHPHSQIYALPFIPSRIRRELAAARRYWVKSRRCLFCRILLEERRDGSRLIYGNSGFILFMPFYAMWPYEVHIYPIKHLGLLTDLNGEDIVYLADVLRVSTATLNNLFSRSMPYIMVFHQSPVKGGYEYYHLHVEFYPLLSSSNRLKYPAGVEWGCGSFTYDGVPELRASELRRSCIEAISKMCSIQGRVLP